MFWNSGVNNRLCIFTLFKKKNIFCQNLITAGKGPQLFLLYKNGSPYKTDIFSFLQLEKAHKNCKKCIFFLQSIVLS
jgi:hypothetical protein